MKLKLAVIPGDGIGPEIVREARKALDQTARKFGHEIEYTELLMGGASIDVHGVPLTDETIAAAKAADAVLMGSIGGNAATSPWYQLPPDRRPEAGLFVAQGPNLAHFVLYNVSAIKYNRRMTQNESPKAQCRKGVRCMELSLGLLQPKERASFGLRALYEAAGCRKYHMGQFEEYALYQENQSFLPSRQVITFTDLDGRLLALKPDVTLSIAKSAQPAPGEIPAESASPARRPSGVAPVTPPMAR